MIRESKSRLDFVDLNSTTANPEATGIPADAWPGFGSGRSTRIFLGVGQCLLLGATSEDAGETSVPAFIRISECQTTPRAPWTLGRCPYRDGLS